MNKIHRLDLLNNSVSYFREAVKYAQQDGNDTDQWKFVIVHVVQAMELAFKEYLRRIHPAFILESVDKPDKTISMAGALSRIRNPTIGALSITDGEKRKIGKAVELRNKLTHYEFDHSHEHIELKFAEIFGFMIFFYKVHLKLETAQFIDERQHQNVIQLVKARAELLNRAKTHISNSDLGDIWICPICTEATFITEDEQCCFCHHKEAVLECTSCGQQTFESDIIDVSDLLHWGYEEGRGILLENFDLDETACPDCISHVKDKIEELRREQYFEDMEMDARGR